MSRSPKSSSPSKSKATSVSNPKTPTPPVPGKPSSKECKRLTAVERVAAAADGPWTVPALRAAYLWPGDLAGAVIAIVELGGGRAQSQMDSLFQSMNQSSPQIGGVSVDGTQNNPERCVDSQDNHDYEVDFRIEIAGAAYLRRRRPARRD